MPPYNGNKFTSSNYEPPSKPGHIGSTSMGSLGGSMFAQQNHMADSKLPSVPNHHALKGGKAPSSMATSAMSRMNNNTYNYKQYSQSNSIFGSGAGAVAPESGPGAANTMPALNKYGSGSGIGSMMGSGHNY